MVVFDGLPLRQRAIANANAIAMKYVGSRRLLSLIRLSWNIYSTAFCYAVYAQKEDIQEVVFHFILVDFRGLGQGSERVASVTYKSGQPNFLTLAVLPLLLAGAA